MSLAGPLFLTGFMGSGKSSVGRELARRLGSPFADTDEAVERLAGRDVAEIFRDSGPHVFRELEWRALRSVAGRRPPPVVATGGGLFAQARARSWMRDRGAVVWLDVPLAVVRTRLGGGPGRPLWPDGDPLAQRALYERRRAVYALADVRVEASAVSVAEVARRVISRCLGGVQQAGGGGSAGGLATGFGPFFD